MIRVAVLSMVFAVVFSQAAFGQEDYKTLYTFNGDSARNYFGGVVSGAGDVNRDGYADVIVGAPNGGDTPGSARVFSGKDGTILYTFQGELGIDWYFGLWVSGAGDVNGDGYADVIVGAPYADDDDGRRRGRARVFSGKDGSTLHIFSGDRGRNENFGYPVSGAGDVNGDGYADVAVGSDYWDDNLQIHILRARVFSGKDGTRLYAWEAGKLISGAGDVNNDGYADLIVGDGGASVSSVVTVFSGKDGTTLHTFQGDSGDILGRSVSGAGDVNGDGYADVIVGATSDKNGVYSGSALIFSGKDGAALYTLYGDRAHDYFGAFVSCAGDVNGDGYADVIVGAPGADKNGVSSGSALIFSGKDGAVLYTFNGDRAGDDFGASVSGAGDVNGDGYADVIVGAPYADNNGFNSGSARIFGDSCPNDKSKAAPGQCGCGIPDTDIDGDDIADCNEGHPPTDISLSSNSILENAGVDSVVGTLTTIDADAGDTFTYTLVSGAGSTDNSYFNISADNLRATNSFDFETRSTYSVRIRATDKNGLFIEKTFTINVTDVDEGVTVAGTTANDSFVATYQGDGATHRWLVTRGGATVFNGVVASAIGLIIDGLAGTDTLQVVGRTTDDRLALGTAKVLVNGAAVTFPGIETLRLAANSGNDALTLVEALPVGVSTSFDGGAGTDRLEVVAGANTWSVTGSGIGNLNSVFPFTAVESLVGGSEVDQFVFTAAGSVAGRVIGGTGADTLNLSAKTTTHTVNLQTNTATSTGGIESIESIVAGGATTDVLIAPNTVNSWLIDGANAGTLNSQVAFSGFENLTGGTAADTFAVGANGGVSRVINGGNGVDLLDLRAKAGAIEVQLGTTPSIPGVVGGYAAVEQVLGNGVEGSKILGTNLATAWGINASGDVLASSTTYRAVGLIEAGTGVDTLTGPALASTWTISSVNAGTINTGAAQVAFSGIENVAGGTQADQFVFGSTGRITGLVNTGTGIDTVSFSAMTEPIEVKLGATTAITGLVGGLSGAERVIGNGVAGSKIVGTSAATAWSVNNQGDIVVGATAYQAIGKIEAGQGTDTLTGPSLATSWQFGELNGGVLNTNSFSIRFSGTEAVVGGSEADRFGFEPDVGGVQSVNGGAGTDVIEMKSIAADVYLDPETSRIGLSPGFMSFLGVELVVKDPGYPPSVLIGQKKTYSIQANGDIIVGPVAYRGDFNIRELSNEGILQGPPVNCDWYIDVNSGSGQVAVSSWTRNRIEFTGMRSFTGGLGVDLMQVTGQLNESNVSTINGGAGEDILVSSLPIRISGCRVTVPKDNGTSPELISFENFYRDRP